MHSLSTHLLSSDTQKFLYAYPSECPFYRPLHSLAGYCRRTTTSYQLYKRVLDFCIALVLLALVSLPLLFLMLLILCCCGRPVFYPQRRIGLNGRAFTIYKFRTMIVQADAHLHRHRALAQVWHTHGKLFQDPRLTRLGSLLRRSSLDELPQVFNILRGDMSLVGPRPIQFSEATCFEDLHPLRHTMKPGLTGAWQILGRSRLGYDQRCMLDCLYTLKCSLREDLAILGKTFPTVLSGKGAC